MSKPTSQNTSIALLKHEMNEVNKHIDKLETSMSKGFDAIHEKLDEMTEKNDTRYASKSYEKGLVWAVGIVIAAVIVGVMNLVIKS